MQDTGVNKGAGGFESSWGARRAGRGSVCVLGRPEVPSSLQTEWTLLLD